MAGESKLPFSFVKEQINRYNRNIFINKKFYPDPRAIPPTPKFYSKFESGELIKISPEKWEYYMNLVDEQLKDEPRQKYDHPMTESQEIGWTPGPMFKYDSADLHLFYHPHVKNDITIVGDLIAASKVTQRPKFTGLPFQL